MRELRLHFHCEVRDYRNEFALFVATDHDSQFKRYVAKPMEFEFAAEGDDRLPPHEPALRLDRRDAQQLIDELWAAGLRPSDGTGNTGQLGATERHLADMRALVFKQAGVEPPKK